MAAGFKVGDRIEVRARFDERWVTGFEVAGLDEEGVRIRRLSDGEELPVPFPPTDVRREHKATSMWWVTT
jgi:hypothetical protein